MRDATIDAAFRAFAAERRYGDATVARWLTLVPRDGAALFALARELRLGDHQLRDLWEWAEEIATRDGSSLTQVLETDPVAAARRRALGRNDKLKQLKGVLRRLRFPQLAAVEDRLHALVRELGLPDTVRVTLPEFLEGDIIRIEIVAGSAAALRDAVAGLLAATRTPACEAIFDVLTEAP
jgi:hypothetical protein